MSSQQPRLQLLASSGGAVGSWCQSSSTVMAEVLGAAGFDLVCVDCQHGSAQLGDLPCMFAAIDRSGALAAVRVPAVDAVWIPRALDAGAEVLIVPMMDTADDVRQLVSMARFPPLGARSWGASTRARIFYDAMPGEGETDRVACVPMIETARAVSNAADICKVAGIDGILIGEADLAVSLGHPPRSAEMPTDVREAIQSTKHACRAAGLLAAIATANPSSARAWLEQDFDIVLFGGDVSWVNDAARTNSATAKANGRT
jgi:4-hydroxy-2-oxoheptanedioate aldolase